MQYTFLNWSLTVFCCSCYVRARDINAGAICVGEFKTRLFLRYYNYMYICKYYSFTFWFSIFELEWNK